MIREKELGPCQESLRSPSASFHTGNGVGEITEDLFPFVGDGDRVGENGFGVSSFFCHNLFIESERIRNRFCRNNPLWSPESRHPGEDSESS